ncbi:MAG TPA: hypothetical protein VGF46_02560, partial [Gaiellales bacterium]
PEHRSGGTHAATVFVVDDSFWMQADGRRAELTDALGRLEAARGGAVAVVAADATPHVLYRGSGSGARAAVGGLRGSATTADLGAAVALGAGLLGGGGGRLVVLRAPESPAPAVQAAAGQLVDETVGALADDQGIFAPRARCGIGPNEDCEVLATVRNDSATARSDRYTASAAGQRTVAFHVAVPARSSTAIALTARPGSILRLRLTASDSLALDDSASVAVPGTDNAPAAATVTLVGDPTSALPLAQALASIPGVSLQLRTPASYRARDAERSELVVLDGWIPDAGLPEAPAVLLVAPPRLPGGARTGVLATAQVSALDRSSPLLAGVDLASLSIDRAAAGHLLPPAWMRPVVSSPGGPLLAAGDDGRQRVGVLAFDPRRSNLAQLSALPVLARNLVGWADDWASLHGDGSLSVDAVPGSTEVRVDGGRSLSLDGGLTGLTDVSPGVHAITTSGGPAVRRRTLVSALAASPDERGSVDLTAWARSTTAPGRRDLVPWLIALVLVALAAEWAVWRRIRR